MGRLVDGGFLIVIEGIDGAGTTTQTSMLSSMLDKLGWDVHETRQPSDGPVGRLLREYLAGSGGTRDQMMMALLFAADRAEHIQREVLPALRRGAVVVSDRWHHSSLAYQGIDGDRGWVADINRGSLCPDLTIFLEVGLDVAESRRSGRQKTEEFYETTDFQRRVARVYGEVLGVLRKHEDVVVINGERAVDDVAEVVLACAVGALAHGRRGQARARLEHRRDLFDDDL